MPNPDGSNQQKFCKQTVKKAGVTEQLSEKFFFSRKICYVLLTQRYLSTKATFFGGQSIHRLLFNPSYNFPFLSVPKVTVIERFNCTVVNAKNKPSKLLVGL